MRKPAALLAVLLAGTAASTQAPGPRGYYRFPALAGDTVVFTAEGDLWVVGISGGTARRLTSHPGEETSPAVSPDGQTVAFTATYEGPAEVYTMPLLGGRPVRRTYEGGATVVGWNGDATILYSTRAWSTLPNTQLARLDLASGRRELVPLAQAADGSVDAAGTLVFTRLSFQGSHTRAYRGGTAQQLWRFGQGAREAEPLTRDYDGTSKGPMWWQGRVYFLSDRDGSMNLWSMDPSGGGQGLRQHTRHRGWDIRGASLSNGRVAYQLGADLRLFTIASGEDREIPIALASDFDQTRERWITNPMEYLTAAHLSPTGDRVVLTARGQVFVAPHGAGRLVEASRRPGVRYRSARFAPDGQSVVVLSDETDETEWWRLAANGVGARDQLTRGGAVLKWDGAMSPDGRWLAWADKNAELWLLDARAGTSARIDSSGEGDFGDLAWSPDSRWLVYRQPLAAFSRLVLYSTESRARTPITSDRVDSYSPAWSPDGRWLYFLSDRNFQSLVGAPWGPRQPEPFFDRQTRIYQLALQPGLRPPFRPADEVAREDSIRAAANRPAPAADTAAARGAAPRRGAQPAAAPATVRPAAQDTARRTRVELDGLASRLYEVPVPAGNYAALAVNGTRLFWLSRETTIEGRRHLMAIDTKVDPGDPIRIVEGVTGYELSADGKKLLVRQTDALHVIDASAGAGATLGPRTRVDLSGWSFSFDPREEWRQMFVEAWRLERDYFYDRGMHGNDWPAIRRKYEPLVERVTTRAELADLMAQMVAELSALHTFVNAGDVRRGQDQIIHGSLGAMLARDSAAGGWRIARLFRSDPDYPGNVGPLMRPEVGAREGDVIEQINGIATLSVPDPAVLLRNQGNRQVRIRLRRQADGESRDVIVTPVTAGRATGLRYDDWELTRREMVDSVSRGRIGYVHLRAMGGGDIAQWTREFYPVFDRQGLIVDVRHNSGGNIDSWILGRLLRRPWFYWQPRVGNPYWNMQWAFRGHMVVLVDENTASDGEAFAEGFRRLGLGRVIGTRTWGGEIWLTSSNVLVDRGIATAAEFGVYGPEGAWLIEGRGVEPDVVVDNLPAAAFRGEDAQLMAGIAHLEQLLRERPVALPAAPAHPTPGRGRP